MNNNINKPIGPFFLHALAVGVGAFLAQDAQSQSVLYDNTADFQANFIVDNNTIGNEVVLAGSSPMDFISSLTFQFSLVNNGASPLSGSPSGTEEVELTLLQNNGAPFGSTSYLTPNTVLYSSTFLNLKTLGLSTFTQGENLTFNPNVTVPQDFTWVVTFEGVPSTETAGLAIFNAPAGPSVGGNYQDAWYLPGAIGGSGAWSLNVANSGPSLQFGATLTGTAVPEPSTIALGLMGASAFLVRRRKA
jgi:hypothetical protein